MNLQSLRRYLPALTLLVIALDLVILPRFDALFFANMRYGQCARLAQTDPAKALAFAKSWRASRPGSPLAQHCEALALFVTKDYTHAAEAFAGLAKEASATNPTLAAQLLAQAARAYNAAGQPDMAKALSIDIIKNNPKNGVGGSPPVGAAKTR